MKKMVDTLATLVMVLCSLLNPVLEGSKKPISKLPWVYRAVVPELPTPNRQDLRESLEWRREDNEEILIKIWTYEDGKTKYQEIQIPKHLKNTGPILIPNYRGPLPWESEVIPLIPDFSIVPRDLPEPGTLSNPGYETPKIN